MTEGQRAIALIEQFKARHVHRDTAYDAEIVMVLNELLAALKEVLRDG